jgi:hypothetical protein
MGDLREDLKASLVLERGTVGVSEWKMVQKEADNLAIWNSLERTDPKHVKPITGKSYKGNSPRPHWVIWKLTEKFGPVGLGFGWEVLREGYIDGIVRPDGIERLHELRIRFWWRVDGERCEVESYGGTTALFRTKDGPWKADEDAAKKSLTDAITKAASWLGVAGDIFMGRWDDSKYVAELEREARQPTTPPQQPVEPPHETKTTVSVKRQNPPVSHDANTGKISQRHNHGSVIRTAWEDGIRDGLPKGHTARQFFSACTTQIATQLRGYKTLDGLNGGWGTHAGILEQMRLEANDLYETLYAVYSERSKALTDAPKTPRATPLTQAEGLKIIETLGLCEDERAIDEYLASLEPYARNHQRVVAAANTRRMIVNGTFGG